LEKREGLGGWRGDAATADIACITTQISRKVRIIPEFRKIHICHGDIIVKQRPQGFSKRPHLSYHMGNVIF
jgi:hypothetical protein